MRLARRCGPFRLVSVIGRGGMGVVYFAERDDGEVSQRAAVKLLNPGWTDDNRERFLRERNILAALGHPNIAHLLDAGHLEDGQPYLAMEYVEGQPIDRYCEGLALQQKLELFLKVCAAVEYLHQQSLVHRDLKPSNILVTANGEPKLLDFGISKMLDLGGDVTAPDFRMLTPKYASPEQVSGSPVGRTSDIYSLGAVFHEILTGAPQETPSNRRAPRLTGDLALVIRTALRPEPDARYQSVEQFAADLRAVLDSKPIRARKGDWIYRARKFAARRPFAIALSGVAAALALAAGAAGVVPLPSRFDRNPDSRARYREHSGVAGSSRCNLARRQVDRIFGRSRNSSARYRRRRRQIAARNQRPRLEWLDAGQLRPADDRARWRVRQDDDGEPLGRPAGGDPFRPVGGFAGWETSRGCASWRAADRRAECGPRRAPRGLEGGGEPQVG